MDTRLQVPVLSPGAGGQADCFEVCVCGASGRLEDCKEMPCVDTSKACVVGGQRKSRRGMFVQIRLQRRHCCTSQH